MADGDDMTICFEILSAIAKYPSLQNRAALPMLQRRMQDDDVDHRRVAMFGIYAIEKNERILMVALDDPCDDNVLWAVLGLEFLGPNAKDAVPFLERRVNDKNEKVRNGVRDALLAIDPERFQHLKSLRKIE
jgi:HEAT repeat protein